MKTTTTVLLTALLLAPACAFEAGAQPYPGEHYDRPAGRPPQAPEVYHRATLEQLAPEASSRRVLLLADPAQPVADPGEVRDGAVDAGQPGPEADAAHPLYFNDGEHVAAYLACDPGVACLRDDDNQLDYCARPSAMRVDPTPPGGCELDQDCATGWVCRVYRGSGQCVEHCSP